MIRMKLVCVSIRRQYSDHLADSLSSTLNIGGLFYQAICPQLALSSGAISYCQYAQFYFYDTARLFNSEIIRRGDMFEGKLVFAAGNFGDFDIFLYDFSSNQLKQL